VDVPAACKGANLPVFRMKQKVSDEVLDERGQPFRTGPLIDQRGDFVRYAIHMNRETFDYIHDNQLYNEGGQLKFSAAKNVVDLPSGTNGSAAANGNAATPPALGSIVIKSAWRLLDPAKDKMGRYHKSDVLVYTAPSDDPPIKERCEARTVGLVGFHIMHKSAGHPQWLWSTFEQVDNLRGNAAAGVGATFYNPAVRRPINRPPPLPWNPNVKKTPSQIVRDIPIDRGAQQLNLLWQKQLAAVNPASVWQYYQLISTQWPSKAFVPDPRDKTKRVMNGFGAPAPQNLGNSTLETYTQRSSSCIACHMNATTTDGKFGDFSYLLQRAQPEKKP
jgi:hypothetical protein